MAPLLHEQFQIDALDIKPISSHHWSFCAHSYCILPPRPSFVCKQHDEFCQCIEPKQHGSLPSNYALILPSWFLWFLDILTSDRRTYLALSFHWRILCCASCCTLNCITIESLTKVVGRNEKRLHWGASEYSLLPPRHLMMHCQNSVFVQTISSLWCLIGFCRTSRRNGIACSLTLLPWMLALLDLRHPHRNPGVVLNCWPHCFHGC